MIDYCKTIFLGDCYEYLSVLAKEYDDSAWLLDQSGCVAFKNSLDQNITVYTSLGDLSKNLSEVFDVLCHATTIFYCPPVIWSDKKIVDITDPTSSMQGLTETLLMLLPESVKVQGLSKFDTSQHNPIPLTDQRKIDAPQIWVAGCSISHGVGVDSNLRFGELLAKELKLECSFLTRPGAAIDWAADQILRSDIRPEDTVVWGITDWCRLTHVHDHQLLNGINVNSYRDFPNYHDIVSVDSLFSHQTYYHNLYSIQQVINYCEKVGARLLLIGVLLGNYALLNFLLLQKNYIHIPYQIDYQSDMLVQRFRDLGTDLLHPGPDQHQEYKNIILNFIKLHF
jgi:hypothetical protein